MQNPSLVAPSTKAEALRQVLKVLHAGRQGACCSPAQSQHCAVVFLLWQNISALCIWNLHNLSARAAAQHPDLIEKRRKLYADRIRRYISGAPPDRPPVPRHPGAPASPTPEVRRRNTGP